MNDYDATIGLWRARTCEWKDPPESDTAPECGKPPIEGRAYCPECHRKAYQEPKPKGRKNEHKKRVSV